MWKCRPVEKLRLRSPHSTALNLPDAPSRSTKLSLERSGAVAVAVAVVVVGMEVDVGVVVEASEAAADAALAGRHTVRC